MKTLLILRHAKAVPKDPSLSDHDRPYKKLTTNDVPISSRGGKDPVIYRA